MDRLIEAIEDKQNPSVVGLDPTEALVPKQVVASFAEEIAEQVEDPTEAPAAQLSVAFFEFNRAIIDAVADIVPAVKPQIAMYEALGPAGIDVYSNAAEAPNPVEAFAFATHPPARRRLDRRDAPGHAVLAASEHDVALALAQGKAALKRFEIPRG